jgi:hypothetical protein
MQITASFHDLTFGYLISFWNRRRLPGKTFRMARY